VSWEKATIWKKGEKKNEGELVLSMEK
jgi:hypothetical protein